MFFVAKICKRALRASVEGNLAVAASTPTYSSLALGNVMSFRCDFVFPRCKCEFLCSPSLAPAQVEPGRGEGGEQGVRW